MKRTLYCAICLALLVVSAASCGAAPATYRTEVASVPPMLEMEEKALMPEAPMAEPIAVDEYRMEDSDLADTSQADLVPAQQTRVVIYTGHISLVVKDTRESAEKVAALAREQGGYVSDSNLYVSDEVLRGSITIRILAENYETALASLREMAIRVESENTSSQDVTEEFTDLEARKANLEVTEKALQELLEDRQKTGRTQDILDVYRELTNIRGQIEQIEGRLRYLSNQAALSTITVELIPDALYQPVTVAGWEPRGVAKSAVQALLKALQGVATLLIWAVILGIPLLIIILLPIFLLVVIIRALVRRRKRRKAAQESPPAAE
jgi:hypothetical protein